MPKTSVPFFRIESSASRLVIQVEMALQMCQGTPYSLLFKLLFYSYIASQDTYHLVLFIELIQHIQAFQSLRVIRNSLICFFPLVTFDHNNTHYQIKRCKSTLFRLKQIWRTSRRQYTSGLLTLDGGNCPKQSKAYQELQHSQDFIRLQQEAL